MSIVAWGRAAMRRGMLITAAAEIFLYHYCVLIRDFSTIQSTEGDLRQPSESQNVSPYWQTPLHPGASGRVRPRHDLSRAAARLNETTEVDYKWQTRSI
jgi:hypothetical protein